MKFFEMIICHFQIKIIGKVYSGLFRFILVYSGLGLTMCNLASIYRFLTVEMIG